MGNTSIRSALYSLLCSDLSAVVDDQYLSRDPEGDPVGVLPVDAPIRAVAAVNLSRAFVKKFQDEIDAEAAEVRAKVKFLDANDRSGSWQPPRGLSSLSLESEFEQELWGTWCWNFRKFWNSIEHDPRYDGLRDEYTFLSWDEILTPEKIAYFADVGPGAVVGGEGTSFLEKFSGRLTYSGPLAKRLWELKCSNPKYRNLEYYLRLSEAGLVEVGCNQLLFVPKTVRECRTICVEPSLEMFFQQGCRFLLELQLMAHYGIDLSYQQDRNQKLALVGSLDGSYGTIDLTSASDMIAYQLVQAGMPSSQFRLLDGLRSKRTCLPDGSEVDLQMFSTMGNGFTFPLMTAIFAAAVETVYQLLDIPFSRGCRNWAVNGDDIIVVKAAYDTTIRLLRLLGFVPNLDKSFNEGFFRESCGYDCYKGRNVRGIYLKTLRQPQDAISCLNRLVAWSAEWDIPLPLTCAFLAKRVPKLFRVPFHESETAGLRVPFDSLPPKRERKWIKLADAKRQLYGIPYHYWKGRPNEMPIAEFDFKEEEGEFSEHRDQTERCVKSGFVFPPSAILLSLVKGEIRRGRITHRASARGVRYGVAEGWTHSWDSIPWVGGPFPNGLVPLNKDYVSKYMLALSRCGLA